MIVQLVGTIVELTSSTLVLDVQGVGYELGVSATTAAELPPAGTQGVRVLTRMVVREDAVDLYGFGSKEERALFDRLVGISGVGPSLALLVLSSFTPAQLAAVVASGDASRLTVVPRVGKKLAGRLMLELQGVFQKDATLLHLVGEATDVPQEPAPVAGSVVDEVVQALLSMGFTSQEATLALDGYDASDAATIEGALSYALKRLGGGA